MKSVEEVKSVYPVVMDNAAARVVAAVQSLDELSANPEHLNAWKNCDFIALQVRKICELILLGSSVAHFQDGKFQFNLKEWHPERAFRNLEAINENPLPYPAELQLNKNGNGQHHIEPKSLAVSKRNLLAIYGKCGDLLHIPSAYRILQGKSGEFDIGQFGHWLMGFSKLLQCHLLFLPEFEVVLVCTWSEQPEDKTKCFQLSAGGPALFDSSKLPEFNLLDA